MKACNETVYLVGGKDKCRELSETLSELLKEYTPYLDARTIPNIITFAKLKQTIYVMPGTNYESWCKGRTYYMDGKLYHSGDEITKGETP